MDDVVFVAVCDQVFQRVGLVEGEGVIWLGVFVHPFYLESSAVVAHRAAALLAIEIEELYHSVICACAAAQAGFNQMHSFRDELPFLAAPVVLFLLCLIHP